MGGKGVIKASVWGWGGRAPTVGQCVGWWGGSEPKLGGLRLCPPPQRQRSLAGMRKRRCGADGDPEAEDPGGSENAEAESELSDAEIYRREVGREPEPGGGSWKVKEPRSGGVGKVLEGPRAVQWLGWVGRVLEGRRTTEWLGWVGKVLEGRRTMG